MPLKVRAALACVLGLLVVAGSALALEEIVITLRSGEWGPSDLTVRRGQVVTWKWETGRHTIMLGDGPDDPKKSQVAVIDSDHPSFAWEAKDLGKFRFFSAERPNITATVTVQSSTQVNQKTWGWLKSMFENPNARTRLD